MNNSEIFERLGSIQAPPKDYLVFETGISGCYFGKDYNSNIVFMITSNIPNVTSVHQETKSLRFVLNKKCICHCSGTYSQNAMHVLTCKETNEEKIQAFIRLTKSFATTEVGSDQYFLAKLFSSISALFDRRRVISEMELQGLFAELYTILYLNKFDCDISKYWQSRNRMKFDFSLTGTKRIEIKSTLKPERLHHFRHEQLLSNLYDIRIVSMLLRKSDTGISLAEVANQIKERYSDDFSLMLHVETTLSQIDDDSLHEIKYDASYLESNLRFYDAADIPHFSEKTPEGVFNAEYDCLLANISHVNINDFISWIEEGVKNV